jgi:hypothetical protein
MSDLSDEEDPQLTNSLRQHRSIVPPALSDSEARLMSKSETASARKKRRSKLMLWRRIFSGFGFIATGLIGATIHYMMNPLEPTVAEIELLDRYLLAHSRNFAPEQVSIDNSADLDAFLLQEYDPDRM